MSVLETAKGLLVDLLRQDHYVGNLYDYGLTIEEKLSDLQFEDIDDIVHFMSNHVDDVEEYLDHAENDLGIYYDDPHGKDIHKVYFGMMSRACTILYTYSSFVSQEVIRGDNRIYVLDGADPISIKIADDVLKVNQSSFEEIW